MKFCFVLYTVYLWERCTISDHQVAVRNHGSSPFSVHRYSHGDSWWHEITTVICFPYHIIAVVSVGKNSCLCETNVSVGLTGDFCLQFPCDKRHFLLLLLINSSFFLIFPDKSQLIYTEHKNPRTTMTSNSFFYFPVESSVTQGRDDWNHHRVCFSLTFLLKIYNPTLKKQPDLGECMTQPCPVGSPSLQNHQSTFRPACASVLWPGRLSPSQPPGKCGHQLARH